MLLPITLTMAGAAALLNIWLASRVGALRRSAKVLHGDGGNEMLMRRMRAQANFVEYTPFFLILVGLIELAQGPQTWLWLAGIAYILARIVHAFGMDKGKLNRLRMIGIAVSLLVLAGLAFYAIALSYIEQPRPAAITYAGADSSSLSGGTKLS